MSIKIQMMTVRRAESYLCKDQESGQSVLLIAAKEGIVICDGGISNDSPEFWKFLNNEPMARLDLLDIDDENVPEATKNLITLSRKQSVELELWIGRNFKEDAEETQVIQDFLDSDSEPPF